MPNIHPTAIIEDGVSLAEDVTVGPFCWIKTGVNIGDGTTIGGHCIIEGPTEIGQNNQITNYVSLGAKPQDKGYDDSHGTRLIIGDGNFFGDYVQICRGTIKEEARTTRVGNDNYIMAHCHIGHDCVLGDGIIMANTVNLAGHIHVEDKAVFGGSIGIHQFCRVGELAMMAGGTIVALDTPPYCKVAGYKGSTFGLNVIGLRRNGVSREAIKELRVAYKTLFRSGLPLSTVLPKLREDHPDSPQVAHWIEFFESSKRGVIRDRDLTGRS
ncbi:acyl-ACP--UDP-N-acetylglucosamine O-acyltransferase [Planctomycetota bacterium]|nr:acyl-ACP--UDP-N-acetylglucosamine O-acyltransferase [Planctomycetota bacterium]